VFSSELSGAWEHCAVFRRAMTAWLSLLLLSSCGPAPSGAGIPSAVTPPSPPASAAGSSYRRPTSSPVAPSPADWPVYHRDPARTGNDEAFPAFDGSLTRAWSTPLDGAVYAEPLVLGGGSSRPPKAIRSTHSIPPVAALAGNATSAPERAKRLGLGQVPEGARVVSHRTCAGPSGPAPIGRSWTDTRGSGPARRSGSARRSRRRRRSPRPRRGTRPG